MNGAEIHVDLTPPSMNTDKVRHWRSFARVKQAWQADFERLLLAEGLPRPISASGTVHAKAILRFPDRRRRDSENFRVVLSKALGDALVRGRWLDDDTDEDWRLEVSIDRMVGPRRTSVFLTWTEAE